MLVLRLCCIIRCVVVRCGGVVGRGGVRCYRYVVCCGGVLLFFVVVRVLCVVELLRVLCCGGAGCVVVCLLHVLLWLPRFFVVRPCPVQSLPSNQQLLSLCNTCPVPRASAAFHLSLRSFVRRRMFVLVFWQGGGFRDGFGEPQPNHGTDGPSSQRGPPQDTVRVRPDRTVGGLSR